MSTDPPPKGGGQRARPPGHRTVAHATTGARTAAKTPAAAEPTNTTGNGSGPHQHGCVTGNGDSEPAATPSDEPGSERANPNGISPDGGRGSRDEGIADMAGLPERRSYANVVRDQQPSSRPMTWADMPEAPEVKGRWRPREQRMLRATMGTDWGALTARTDTETVTGLRQVAMADTPVHQDSALRHRTGQETQALLAYLNGDLEIPHAPKFLKATMPLLQRAILEQFHETHVEATLTANVLPRAKLRRNMTHMAIFALIYEANRDSERGRLMVAQLMDAVKLLQFDGIHTLQLVFHSRRLANAYVGMAIRLQGTCVELEDTDAAESQGSLRIAQLRRQYAVRIYGADHIRLVALLTALGQLSEVQILDAERPRLDSTDIVDNRYVTVSFLGVECPTVFRGITKIGFAGKVVTVHHHLVQQRMPCARCYAPHHTTGYCKVKSMQLERQRVRAYRDFGGYLPQYSVGAAVQYRHSDEDSLTSFLRLLQGELIADVAAHPVEQGTQVLAPPKMAAEPDTPSPEGTGHTTRARTAGPPTDAAANSEGFVTVQRHLKKTQAAAGRAQGQGMPTKEAGSSSMADTQTRTGTTAHHGQPSRNAQAEHKEPPKTRPPKKKTPQPPTFKTFQRDRAHGRFAALDTGEEDSEDESSGSDLDEAPYAYGEREREHPPTEATASNGADRAAPQPCRQPGPADSEASSNMDMEQISDSSTDLSEYVGSSAPFSTQSSAPMPGSDCPFSLASSAEDACQGRLAGTTTWDDRDASAPIVADIADKEVSSVFPASAELSEDGFLMGQVVNALGMPQQLPVFLGPFNGSLVQVPANGQCAYSALHATTSYVDTGELHFTCDVVRGVNLLKRNVYTLMMANLAADVECNVVDPREELARLYPALPTPTSLPVATATLYSHYAQERVRSANSTVPSDFWAGAEVLRAMAQYLREPLFVLGVQANNDAHVQRYYFKEYVLDNGEIHESGCGGAMTDCKAKALLYQYTRLHVLPPMLVIRRNEGHFYGVHYGGIAARWFAEGDRTFADNHCATYEWYDEVVAQFVKCSPQSSNVEAADDTDAVNWVLIGSMEHRDRLDIVHDRLDLPRLNSKGLAMEELESRLGAEGERLQRVAGPAQPATVAADAATAKAHAARAQRRHPITAQGKVAQEVLVRILDSIGMEPELLPDRNKLRHLLKENTRAFRAWKKQETDIPWSNGYQDDQDLLGNMMPWLLEHRPAFHRLLRYLPYPELAVKALSTKIMLQWGALERYDATVQLLHNLAHDSALGIATTDHCKTWVTACSINGGAATDLNVAKDVQKWGRLYQLCPATRALGKPDGVDDHHWAVLHVLPYAVWAWSASPMGSVQAGCYNGYYTGQPVLQQLCTRIVDRAAWGDALTLSCGLTWDDRIASMEAGLAAQATY